MAKKEPITAYASPRDAEILTELSSRLNVSKSSVILTALRFLYSYFSNQAARPEVADESEDTNEQSQ